MFMYWSTKHIIWGLLITLMRDLLCLCMKQIQDYHCKNRHMSCVPYCFHPLCSTKTHYLWITVHIVLCQWKMYNKSHHNKNCNHIYLENSNISHVFTVSHQKSRIFFPPTPGSKALGTPVRWPYKPVSSFWQNSDTLWLEHIQQSSISQSVF